MDKNVQVVIAGALTVGAIVGLTYAISKYGSGPKVPSSAAPTASWLGRKKTMTKSAHGAGCQCGFSSGGYFCSGEEASAAGGCAACCENHRLAGSK